MRTSVVMSHLWLRRCCRIANFNATEGYTAMQCVGRSTSRSVHAAHVLPNAVPLTAVFHSYGVE